MKNYNKAGQKPSSARKTYLQMLEEEEERRRRERQQGTGLTNLADTYKPAGSKSASSMPGLIDQSDTYRPAAAASGGKSANSGSSSSQAKAPQPKTANMFYTNTPNSGTIVPRFNSIAAYNRAIEEGKKKLDELTHQQFQAMLKNDVPGMNALEKQYKDTKKYLDSLKAELGEVMGAGIHGKKGNQLTGSGWFGRKMDELSANDTAMRVTQLGYSDGPPPMPQRPPVPEGHPDREKYEKHLEEILASEETDKKGVTSSGGGYADFFREQREGDTDKRKTDYSKADRLNQDIIDTTIESAVMGIAQEAGGYVLKATEKGALEFVAEGIPYVGIIIDCFGQYFASEDAKTALLENYVNFGANLWNQQNGREFRDALVWSPMTTFDCDQDFLDGALLFQDYLYVYGIVSGEELCGLYWDELVEEDRQIKEYNKKHPEEPKQSKLDSVIWIATKTLNPVIGDYTREVYLPFAKTAVSSWVAIYFGNWGMNF